MSAASRTDAGVHAEDHAACFSAETDRPAETIGNSLNGLLSEDIRITSIQEIPEDFHLRGSILGKIYRYRILNTPYQSVTHRLNYWWIKKPISAEKLRHVAPLLTGTKDFSAYRAANCSAPLPVKTIYGVWIREHNVPDGRIFHLDFYGGGFLKNMIRIFTGSMIDYSFDRLDYETFRSSFIYPDREQLGQTAPAKGLTLLSTVFRDDSGIQHTSELYP